MIEPVEFDYAPTAEEFYDATSTAPAWSALRASVVVLFAVPLTAYAVFVMRYPAEAWNFAAILMLYVAMALVATAVVVWRAVARLRASARAHSNAMRAEGYHMRVSADGLEMRSVNVDNTVRWGAFVGACPTKKNLVLRLRTGGTVPIPLRYLDEPVRRLIVEAVSAVP